MGTKDPQNHYFATSAEIRSCLQTLFSLAHKSIQLIEEAVERLKTATQRRIRRELTYKWNNNKF